MRTMLITTAATAALLLPGATPVLAATPTGGCAAGFLHWTATTEPYQVDDAVDEAGNGDGYVCARALGEGHAKQFGVDATIYMFTDNTLVVGRR